MIGALASLLHSLRDGLLVAAAALERGEEVEAAAILEQTITETRAALEELRAA